MATILLLDVRQINLTAKDIALNLQYRLIKAVSFAVGFSQWNR
ncbi:MAG TPA: hypothetical protein VK205_03510 [Prolixibacteraceae bacterium]|nr:hypothetical protein [Prolixibacteraceae bacterium]